MNPDSPSPPAATPEASAATPPPSAPPVTSKKPVIVGFILGAISWLTVLIPQRDYGQILPLIFNCFALPVIAIILAIIPATRRFGLGLLLAAGLGWLVLGAICGGILR